MPLVPLTDVLRAATDRRAAALGLVCLGWEDAVAFVAAGEATGAPVILSAGPSARRAIPLPVWGAMFTTLATKASVPVVAHLDHGTTLAEVEAALDAGFTSIMFDGSALPLADNIRLSQEALAMARTKGASFEGEVGQVGYAGQDNSAGTDSAEARTYAQAVQPDALAISVGNVHLHTQQVTPLDWDLLQSIRDAVTCPLVLHGGSGVPQAHRRRAARDYNVAKINLGTEIRQVYGHAIRQSVQEQPDAFDRLTLQHPVTAAIQTATETALSAAWSP